MTNLQHKKPKSFGVAPSPFNTVKLELGIILVLGALLLLGLNSITQDLLVQCGLLFIAGIVGMLWIVWRTKTTAKNQNNTKQSVSDSHISDSNNSTS